MTMNVFVYGTLMSPEVVTTLLTRFPRSQPGQDLAMETPLVGLEDCCLELVHWAV